MSCAVDPLHRQKHSPLTRIAQCPFVSMVNFSSSNVQTPQRPMPSNPAWLSPTVRMSPSVLAPPRTPRSRKSSRNSVFPSVRSSPLMTPDKVVMSDGSPMKLFTPKAHMAEMEARRRRTSLGRSPGMGPPTQPLAHPRTLFLPPNLRSRKSSTKLSAPPVVLGTPLQKGRPRDPTRPRVQLLKVMSDCVSYDTAISVQWTVKDGLLNGRNDERDRRNMWRPLSDTVHKFWPNLGVWIMNHTPSEANMEWFTGPWEICDNDHCTDSSNITAEHSSLARVGFYSQCFPFPFSEVNAFVAYRVLFLGCAVSDNSYMAACELVVSLQESASVLQSLMDKGVNPFFLIYLCADCNVPLPAGFSLQLLWKHLAALIRAQCWRGLGSNAAILQQRPKSSVVFLPPEYSHTGEDPEGNVTKLLAVAVKDRPFPEAPLTPSPPRKVQITITGHRWVALTPVGILWYQAGDLDERDVSSLAVIDTLTRLLPHCREGTLEIHTNDVQLLWGYYGAPTGAWVVARAACASYDVHLRAEWDELKGLNTDPALYRSDETGPTPRRDPAVVNVVLDRFRGLEVNSAAYDCMAGHFTRVSA